LYLSVLATLKALEQNKLDRGCWISLAVRQGTLQTQTGRRGDAGRQGIHFSDSRCFDVEYLCAKILHYPR